MNGEIDYKVTVIDRYNKCQTKQYTHARTHARTHTHTHTHTHIHTLARCSYNIWWLVLG